MTKVQAVQTRAYKSCSIFTCIKTASL